MLKPKISMSVTAKKHQKNSPAENRGTHLRALVPILLYLLLSILFCTSFFSWADLGSHGIMGGDPALNAWILQRVSHNLVTDPLHPLDGNVFHPEPNALCSWDHMTSLALFNTVFRLFSDSPWFGYNILIFLAYFISALGGYRLAMTLTGSRLCSFWAGLFWGFLFFRAHHFTHLQILSFQWIPFCVESLVSFLKTEKTRHLVKFVIFVLLQSLVGWYLAIINGFLLLIVLIFITGKKNLNKTFVLKTMIGGLIFICVMLPFVLAYSNVKGSHKSEMASVEIRSSGEQILPWDYISPPASTLPGQFFDSSRYSIWGENTLYIGFIPLILAFAGLWFCLKKRKTFTFISCSRLAMLSTGLILAGGIFSLGHNSHTLGIPLPWHFVCKAIPYFGFIRATPRFSLLLYMGVLILSSAGLYFMLEKISSHKRKVILTSLLSLLFILEVFPFDLPFKISKSFRYSSVDQKIAEISEEAGRELTVAHIIPNLDAENRKHFGEEGVLKARRVPDNVREARRGFFPKLVLGSTLHWSRMLSGVSFLKSQTYQDLIVANLFPDERALSLLRLYDVDLLVFHDYPELINDEQLQEMLVVSRQIGELIKIPGNRFILKINKSSLSRSLQSDTGHHP